ncbi:MAG: undecaprenyldiphospho-muramoylpentapeptide beta-N-acetylglucosaminyltransferase [Cyanobacteria bacterium J06633_2]
MGNTPKKLLIAASGTGGHLFPAIATAEALDDFEIEWLGVATRLENQLVPKSYPLNIINVEGFQSGFGLGTVRTMVRLGIAIAQVRSLLKSGGFSGVFTTGGYIAAPAILAARLLGLPTILHESNAIPGKVTRWLSRWCSVVAVGFDAAIPYLPHAYCQSVGTPVRSQFLDSQGSTSLGDLGVPDGVPLIVVVGGSQGAVAVNQLVREAAPAWFDAGAWVVHLTGTNDPDADALQHPHYVAKPFYDDMATLLRRADLTVSRAGAGTLTELAMTHTPSILIPYPFAAEDHQTFNGKVFVDANAARLYQQADLTADQLKQSVLDLLDNPDQRQAMAHAAGHLAVENSADQLAELVRRAIADPEAFKR